MKNILIILCCLLTMGLSAQEHQRGEKREKKADKIETLKIGYITEALNLSPAEAEKFWPIYNQSEKKVKELRNEKRALSRNENQNLSEEEAKDRIDQYISIEQQLVLVNKQQLGDLRKVISNQQIVKLFAAKEKFKKEIVKGLRGKRRNK